MVADDFNGDSFDHTGLGFLHGGYIAGFVTTGRPIETELLPEGTPKWGKNVEAGICEKLPDLDEHLAHGLGDA